MAPNLPRIREYVSDLRYGGYIKTTGALTKLVSSERRYDAEGVLCLTFARLSGESITALTGSSHHTLRNNTRSQDLNGWAPPYVQEYFAGTGDKVVINGATSAGSQLSYANDNLGMTFVQIATALVTRYGPDVDA